MNFDNLSNEELAVAKVKCERSLLYFTRFFFRVLRGNKFIVNWHHEEICNELEKTANYKYELLNINIPPRHSKTELAGINFIAWSLAKNPRGNFLYITASDELRSETSVRIRDIITHPVYIKMFGVEIKKDQSAKNLWRTKQGGGLKTATIFGQITGFGAGRMVEYDNDLIDYIEAFEGCIILDDINKIIDSQSDNANNKKANETIFNTILSRKNSEKTPLINIQQRTGTNDATSELLEHFKDSKMKNLVLPVVIDGKALWPFILSLEGIEKKKNSPKTASTFLCQYMQDPIESEGVLFPRTSLTFFKMEDLDLTKIEHKWLVIDPADEGNDNYSAPLGCHIGAFIYITDVIYDTRDFEYTEPRTIELGKNEGINKIILETNKEGTAYKRRLIKAFPTISVKGIHNTGKKIVRIKNNAFFIKKYMRFRDDYTIDSDYDKFMQDVFKLLKDGSNKDHDDAPDSLAMYAKQAEKSNPVLYS